MGIYEQKSQWKLGLLLAAILIIATSLLYTNRLARNLAEEERQKLKLLYNTLKDMNNILYEDPSKLGQGGHGHGHAYTFMMSVTKSNTSIPVILTNAEGKITSHKNLNDNIPSSPKNKADSSYLYRQLATMKNTYEPIQMMSKTLGDDGKVYEQEQYIYYNDSKFLYQLKIYPFIQLGIISLFLGIAYLAFSAARRAEQNKVWLGMAKETAHQLGTPISSMVGWVELLKVADDPSGTAQMAGTELNKDVKRLEKIAERFSKIGSKPELKSTNIVELTERTVNYVRRRASNKIEITYEYSNNPILVNLNGILFDWVIENLLKNALDAMESEGKISVELKEENNNVLISVTDTGKGIPKSKFRTIFEPGFSTKKRGWGLGLSLSKRIIEIYHSGRIFVHHSSPKGTCFHVIVPKI